MILLNCKLGHYKCIYTITILLLITLLLYYLYSTIHYIHYILLHWIKHLWSSIFIFGGVEVLCKLCTWAVFTVALLAGVFGISVFVVSTLSPLQIGIVYGSQMPNLERQPKWRNLLRPLVRISATWCLEGTKHGEIWPCLILSLTKWQSISMCFVLAWCMGNFTSAIS